MQEFRKRVGKPIDMYYFYSDGIVGNIPKSNIAFTSSSYKIFSGNLILQNVLYR